MIRSKKIYIMIIFAMIISMPLLAQVGELRNNFSIGISGGQNFNSVSFSPSIKQKTLNGFTGGITARYISEKYFAMICGIQLELNYSQRGWSELIEENTDTYSRTMNYLEVPFLAHLAFGKDNGTQFFLNLGPQIAFLLNEKEKKSTPFSPISRTSKQYGKMAENKFDYGILGGAGLEIKTKAGNFLVEGRYYFALSDFYKTTKKDYFSRAAHSTLSARITYLFDLTK
ncbi:porin family protein [uncultured Bacteroides sp.]|uniref:porin family protein n=1 Tax=uncultured Bacteroides sp. TaxID=162156 RepID=UPI002AAA62BF|nr:porin family protein [uncultured Bacteroides sp.]